VLLDKDGNPVRDRKTGRPILVHHKSKEQATDERKLETLLLEHRPAAPASGAVRIWVNAYMPIPASKSKKWKAAAASHQVRPIGKPDIDNILKHLLDVMTGIFWIDDKQVCGAMLEKWYGNPPRYDITLFSQAGAGDGG
jgi:Holliday junction resolvase RusA-like endonuclease